MLKNIGKQLEKSASHDPLVILVQERNGAVYISCRYANCLFSVRDKDFTRIDEALKKLLCQIDDYFDSRNQGLTVGGLDGKLQEL